MFGRKGGLGDSGTKAGTELDGAVVAWAGNQGYKSGGGGLYISGSPSSTWPTQGSPHSPFLVTLSQILLTQLDFKVDPWVPKKFQFGNEVGEIGNQNPRGRV